MDMTSNRPYLIRAYYDWIVDNDCTPHMVVDAGLPNVSVPQAYVSDGQIVLNIAPRASKNFVMDNEAVSFNTRFGGVPCDIYVPINAIMGIYARENGQGMAFQPEAPIKSEELGHALHSVDNSVGSLVEKSENSPEEHLKEFSTKPLNEKSLQEEPDDKPPEPPSPAGGGQPRLRVVK